MNNSVLRASCGMAGVLALILASTVPAAPAAARDEQEASNPALSVEKLLKDALLFRVILSVLSPDGSEELWNTLIEKITIPGRPVDVSLESGGSSLDVRFTLYPPEKASDLADSYVLVAQSETLVNGEYASSLASLPIAHNDEIYYYPLGRSRDSSVENPVEVRMAIILIPYLDTLDDTARASLESAIDSSARFNLTAEEP